MVGLLRIFPQTQVSKREAYMNQVTRRQFVRRATAGLAGILAFRIPPAVAQKREVTMLGWSHFVPESDARLKQLLEKFSREANVVARSDHVPNVQLASKQAAEVQTKAGHDLMMFYNEQTWRYRDQLVDMDDVVGELNKKYGTDIYPFCKDAFFINGHWKALESIWPAIPGNYLQSKFRQVGEGPPDTWADLLRAGKKLK